MQKDKQTFDVSALPLEEYAASLGLAGAPKIKFVSKQEASNAKNKVRQVEDLKKELVKGNKGSSDDDSEEEDDDDGDDDEESEDDDDSLEEDESETETAAKTKGGRKGETVASDEEEESKVSKR